MPPTGENGSEDLATQIAIIRAALSNMRRMREQSLGRTLTADEELALQREVATLPNEAVFALAGGASGSSSSMSKGFQPVGDVRFTLRKTILVTLGFVLSGTVFLYAALNGRIAITGLILSATCFALAGGTVWHYHKMGKMS